MPLYLDTHRLDGPVTLAEVARAHEADLRVQGAHAVQYLRYWVDEAGGHIFCLVDAPDAQAAAAVHREAHGMVADTIHPVTEGIDAPDPAPGVPAASRPSAVWFR